MCINSAVIIGGMTCRVIILSHTLQSFSPPLLCKTTSLDTNMSQLPETDARAQDMVARFNTYEEYLDDQTTPQDLMYLQDETLARKLVELGYRGSGETLKRYV